MKRFMNKKVVAIGLAAGLTLGAAGAAFAYFTTTGSGTGTGVVGTSSNLNINQASITYSNGANLVPSSSAVVTFTVDNSASSAQYLASISLASWTSNKTGCDSTDDPGWITMPTVTVGQDFTAATSGQAVTNSGTITFNDLSTVDQDACKGASLTFTYSGSPS
jgi:hypothetical protein